MANNILRTNFAGLCGFTCKYRYCPVGACYCTAMGKQKKLLKAIGDKGYPANGDANYADGVFYNSTTERPVYIPTNSPFTPLAYTSGEGERKGGDLAGLNSFAYAFGFYPVDSCICLSIGARIVLPDLDNIIGVPDTNNGDEY
ncbi:CAZyme family GH71 and CBM24 [Penicillium canescens]|uniref:CAZyme family GH71 and CBM24 n=1 Tax=Penicillium canescens TaxID=5083 RepID=UPI0026DF8218|nr:CAZyme family GH71 and CBM24 [Penicillium canescens]KAJ6048365.1 CAZyme family GH71 and CBM24 [Penicillium canescens]